jgi:hypothetical protein
LFAGFLGRSLTAEFCYLVQERCGGRWRGNLAQQYLVERKVAAVDRFCGVLILVHGRAFQSVAGEDTFVRE